MHSSRMRTVCCSGRLMIGVFSQGGVCICHGRIWPGGCPPRGVSAYGGVCPGGVYPRGGCWGCTPPIGGQTDTCENITFPQLLLRTVDKTSLLHFLLKPFICYFTSIVEIMYEYMWRDRLTPDFGAWSYLLIENGQSTKRRRMERYFSKTNT